MWTNIIQNSKEKAMNTIALSMELSFTVGTSCSFGILAIAHELISIYYGPAFLACVPILIALTMVPILYGWSNVIRMQYVIPNGRDSIYIAATFSGAIINLLLNFIFIPLYQAYGATIGTIAAQLVVALVFTMSVRKELPLKRYVVKSIPLFVIGLIMFIGIKGVQHFHEESVIWLIIDIIVGGIIYCLFYLLYGKLSKNNLSSLIYTRIFRGNG